MTTGKKQLDLLKSCLTTKAEGFEDFDEWMCNNVERWHGSNCNKEIYDYLGISKADYEKWVEGKLTF